MIGLGTIVNCGTVALGTTLGLLLKGGLPKRFEKTIMSALALCAFFIGLGGVLSQTLVIREGSFSTQYTLLIVLCMSIGAMIGEALDIERRLEGIGGWFKRRIPSGASSGSSTFVEAFVTASLLFCVGAMSIVGALEDGLNANPSILYAKAVMDGVAAVVFTASLGAGVYLSILAVLVYQGGITLLAGFIRPLLSDLVIDQMSCIGAVLIFEIGIKLLDSKKIKVGNLLPAMFLPIFFLWLKGLFPALPW